MKPTNNKTNERSQVFNVVFTPSIDPNAPILLTDPKEIQDFFDSIPDKEEPESKKQKQSPDVNISPEINQSYLTYLSPPHLQSLPQSENPENYIQLINHPLLISKSLYHHSNTWTDTHSLLHKEGSAMPLPFHTLELKSLLESNQAKDGLGNLLSKKERNSLLKQYFRIKKDGQDWTGEHLDADFKWDDQSNLFTLHTNHRTTKKGLEAMTQELLQSCITDKDCKIDLSSINSQGMPTKEGSDIDYWHPYHSNNSVAWFFAGSGWVGRDCHGDRGGSFSSLGVRKIFHRK